MDGLSQDLIFLISQKIIIKNPSSQHIHNHKKEPTSRRLKLQTPHHIIVYQSITTMSTSRILSLSVACLRQPQFSESIAVKGGAKSARALACSHQLEACRPFSSSSAGGFNTNSFDLKQRNTSFLLTQCRWKHASKTGSHLNQLDEMAHEKNRQEAQEKRKKKKEQKAARKGKKGKTKSEPQEATLESASMDDEEYIIEDDHHEDEEEEDLLPDPEKVQARMHKIVTRFQESLKSIRGAEPSVEIFDTVQVEAYGGAATSLQSVAQVVLVSPTRATATCFDPAVAKSVQTALYDQLELHATISPDEPGVVQISLPRVSLESRQKTAHALQKRAEAVRQRVRQVRRKVLAPVKQGVAGKLEHVSKDDAFRVQQEIEAATDKVLQDLNKAAEEKHNSIMAVDS